MEQPRHRVTIVIDTDDNKKFSELMRFIIGLQGVLAPDVELDYSAEISDELIVREDRLEQEHERDKDDLPF